MKINKECIVDGMSEKDYHSDPCPAPSLSSGMIFDLLYKSPAHVFHKSERLNPGKAEKWSKQLDIGSACHDLLLLGGGSIKRLEFSDYKKTEAKQARLDATEAGKVPLLAHDHDRVIEIHKALRRQIINHDDASNAFTGGKPEQSIFWFEEKYGVWCRARIDYVQPKDWLEDYKTTAGSASPQAWIRGHLFTDGKDIQAAWYLRGWKKLTGETRNFRFIVQESSEAPFAASVIAVNPYDLQQASDKCDEALELWAHCLKTNNFAGYPSHTCWAEAPVFHNKEWDDRKLRKQLLKEDNKDIKDMMLRMQAPLEVNNAS